MTLNHSKTWPVSTMAVVQLRVDPHGRTYSTLTGQDEHRDNNHIPSADPKALAITPEHKLRHEQAEQDLHHSRDSLEEESPKDDTSQKAKNGIILPLSKKHLELFTRMAAPALKTIRTDTVSTILEQDEFDSENQGSTVQCNPITSGPLEINEIIPDNFEKFHVLALSRAEENIKNNDANQSVGRRPSNKVDNWDLIYTETNGSKFSKRCNESTVAGHGIKTKTTGMCNKHNECLLPDIPLDARKTTTLRRHYYPEGGWGWVIIVCTVLVHVLNHGIQLSCSQFTMPAAEKFKARPVDVAVYLKLSPEIASTRISARGRKEEKGVNLKYLQDLHEAHEKWLFSQECSAKVVVINANQSREGLIKDCYVFIEDLIK